MLRRTAILALTLIPLAIIASGCAPISVSSHVDRTASFERYHTFAWETPDALPTADPRLDNNPFFHDYLQGAVERHLREHGITLAGNPATADLRIHYHAAVTERFDYAPAKSLPSDALVEPQVIYEESTLMLDMVDARTGRLVWRGWAQQELRGFVDNQDHLKARIEASVVKMLARLPL